MIINHTSRTHIRCLGWMDSFASHVASSTTRPQRLPSPLTKSRASISHVAVANRRGSSPPMPGFLADTGMETRFVPTYEPIAAMNQR